MDGEERRLGNVIGTPIDIITWEQAVARIAAWAAAGESRTVCICNVHSVVTARQDPGFRRVVEGADMAAPDGAPVAWLLRWLGAASQSRINGPDLMFEYCRAAAGRGESIYLYGGSEATNRLLAEHLARRFPGLVIGGAHSPPFRALTPAEDEAVVAAINCSGARTVWVALGCPKQEKWMAAHRGRIRAVMIGVGAAFDYHAGTIARAPLWMQRSGLEWLYRLVSEPRRLWKRYLLSNTLFVGFALRQLLFRQLPK